MLKQKVNKTFRLTYSDLSHVVRQKADFMLRDMDELEKMGITSSKVKQMQADASTFYAMHTDGYFTNKLKLATKVKDDSIEALYVAMRNFNYKVGYLYDPEMNPFDGIIESSMLDKTGFRLLNAAQVMLNRIEELRDELLKKGMTAEDLQNIADLQYALIEAVGQHNLLWAKRELETRKRAVFANKLYKQLSTYCKLAREVFKRSNYEQYNDYVLYKTPAPPDLDVGSQNLIV